MYPNKENGNCDLPHSFFPLAFLPLNEILFPMYQHTAIVVDRASEGPRAGERVFVRLHNIRREGVLSDGALQSQRNS